MHTPQLPLSLRFPRGAGFDTFLDPDGSVVDALAVWTSGGPGSCFLSGPAGTGKTHLSLALCGARCDSS